MDVIFGLLSSISFLITYNDKIKNCGDQGWNTSVCSNHSIRLIMVSIYWIIQVLKIHTLTGFILEFKKYSKIQQHV